MEAALVENNIQSLLHVCVSALSNTRLPLTAKDAFQSEPAVTRQKSIPLCPKEPASAAAAVMEFSTLMSPSTVMDVPLSSFTPCLGAHHFAWLFMVMSKFPPMVRCWFGTSSTIS